MPLIFPAEFVDSFTILILVGLNLLIVISYLRMISSLHSIGLGKVVGVFVLFIALVVAITSLVIGYYDPSKSRSANVVQVQLSPPGSLMNTTNILEEASIRSLPTNGTNPYQKESFEGWLIKDRRYNDCKNNLHAFGDSELLCMNLAEQLSRDDYKKAVEICNSLGIDSRKICLKWIN